MVVNNAKDGNYELLPGSGILFDGPVFKFLHHIPDLLLPPIIRWTTKQERQHYKNYRRKENKRRRWNRSYKEWPHTKNSSIFFPTQREVVSYPYSVPVHIRPPASPLPTRLQHNVTADSLPQATLVFDFSFSSLTVATSRPLIPSFRPIQKTRTSFLAMAWLLMPPPELIFRNDIPLSSASVSTPPANQKRVVVVMPPTPSHH